MVGETGFEPATPWSRTKAGERPEVISGSQPCVNTRDSEAGPVQQSHPVRAGTKDFAAILLLRPTPSSSTRGQGTWTAAHREVAKRLGVCRTAVYRGRERGTLPHIRISKSPTRAPGSSEPGAFSGAGPWPTSGGPGFHWRGTSMNSPVLEWHLCEFTSVFIDLVRLEVARVATLTAV